MALPHQCNRHITWTWVLKNESTAGTLNLYTILMQHAGAPQAHPMNTPSSLQHAGVRVHEHAHDHQTHPSSLQHDGVLTALPSNTPSSYNRLEYSEHSHLTHPPHATRRSTSSLFVKHTVLIQHASFNTPECSQHSHVTHPPHATRAGAANNLL
jgi:hypothetical protein